MRGTALLPTAPTRVLRAPATRSVESVLQEIRVLVGERQALRLRSASPAALERNRIKIARCQWELSYALIDRYLPQPAAKTAA
jgi:hypothetical protein